MHRNNILIMQSKTAFAQTGVSSLDLTALETAAVFFLRCADLLGSKRDLRRVAGEKFRQQRHETR